ncbi:hypothetical protein UO65_5068 [Actinokineospora spheciospongiae]|uniref:Uncharacterized protein n=1 Tax=Actinokineospora spheciospongiae TaxID=909613 RepID=W7IH78_9PSEU|nr:hypothetical protein UO65_5068 [Actinokineospora spheciospongiae]
MPVDPPGWGGLPDVHPGPAVERPADGERADPDGQVAGGAGAQRGHGLQGAVEQARVQQVAARGLQLGHGLPTPDPQRPDDAQRGPVLQPGAAERRVERLDVDLARALPFGARLREGRARDDGAARERGAGTVDGERGTVEVDRDGSGGGVEVDRRHPAHVGHRDRCAEPGRQPRDLQQGDTGHPPLTGEQVVPRDGQQRVVGGELPHRACLGGHGRGGEGQVVRVVGDPVAAAVEDRGGEVDAAGGGGPAGGPVLALARDPLRFGAGGFAGAGEPDEGGGQFRLVRDGEGGAAGLGAAADLAGEGQVAQRRGAGGEEVGDGGGQRAQGRVGAGGQDERLRLPRGVGGDGGADVLLQDDVGVRPARPEGAHGRPPRTGGLPRLRRELRAEAGLRQVDLRVERGEVRRRNQGPVAELEQQLGQARHARGAFQVADVGLHRADGDGGPGAVGAGQGGQLDRVAEGGAGAVGLDVGDPGGVDAGAGEGVGDQGGLGVGVGDGVAGGLAARVECAALEDRPHRVPVGHRGRQRLEQHGAHTLAGDETVRRLVEHAAAVAGGEHVAGAEGGEVRRVGDQVDPARDGHPAVPPPQRLRRQVQGGERGRAGRVDGEAGAGEVEHVGHPVRHRPVRRVPGGEPALGPVLGGGQQPVAAVHQAREHAGGLLLGCLTQVPGRFQQLPAGLQEQPLLRVDVGGVARQDAEQARVELLDAVEEAAPAVVGGVRRAAGVEVLAPVPPGGGDLGDAAVPGGQVAPERVQVR